MALNNPPLIADVLPEIGAGIAGRAVTATLYVSPNGSGADGLTWATAFTTIQDALDAASTDGDDCTLINISPHATNYDINTAGDPAWAANVILAGAYRNWAKILNTNVGATSILKLTGKSAVVNLNFNLGVENYNGLIMTHGGCRVLHCQFVGTNLTGAATALWLDHATGGKYAKVIDCDFLGHLTHMTALKIDQFGRSNFERLRVHSNLVAVHIVGANSDENIFNLLDVGDNALAFDIDAGNEQHFHDIVLHHNTTANVDDEVGDHIWTNMFGAFPITIEPDNLVGVTVNTGAAGVYGGDTQIRAAAAATVPFRIVGVHMEPSTSEWYQIRFSADSGVTFYDILQFDGTKREGSAAPSGTEFIFNAGTRISASARDVSGGDNVKVWLEVQEI